MNPNVYKNINNVLTEAYKEDERKIESNKPFKLDHTPLRNLFIVLGLGWTILMLILFLTSKNTENVFYSIVFGIITPSAVLIILGILIGIFYINFNDDEIIYRNYLGIKKTIKYNDIKNALRTDDNTLELYNNEKKLLTIDLTTFGHKRILNFITNKNIKIKEQSNINNFIIKANNPAKITLAIIGSFLIGMGIIPMYLYLKANPTLPLENKIIPYFFATAFTLFGASLYFNTKIKYIITKKEIICKSFLRKDKILKINEIIGYQKHREEMQIYETYYLIDKNENSISITLNPNYTNIRLLKELIKKEEWPKLRK